MDTSTPFENIRPKGWETDTWFFSSFLVLGGEEGINDLLGFIMGVWSIRLYCLCTRFKDWLTEVEECLLGVEND